jgi:hypothetical protein
MGDWSGLHGQIKSKKLSAKKIFQAVLDDREEWGGDFESDNRFDVSIGDVGDNVVEYVRRIIDSAKSRDPNCKVEIYVSTLFLK